MAEGFFSRWSQRKEAVRKGQEPVPDADPTLVEPAAAPVMAPADTVAEAPAPEVDLPPTLEDAEALTPESDFTRFARRDVAPEVKNAAFKKLFNDPHFNVMDGLDTYIGDYNKPDPIPPEMLKQLTSARFLSLFEEKEEAGELAQSPTVSASPDDPAEESVAQSSTRTAQALPPAENHADPDLRLQQDDAPGPESPGAGSR
jgi:hypothetical protein